MAASSITIQLDGLSSPGGSSLPSSPLGDAGGDALGLVPADIAEAGQVSGTAEEAPPPSAARKFRRLSLGGLLDALMRLDLMISRRRALIEVRRWPLATGLHLRLSLRATLQRPCQLLRRRATASARGCSATLGAA